MGMIALVYHAPKHICMTGLVVREEKFGIHKKI